MVIGLGLPAASTAALAMRMALAALMLFSAASIQAQDDEAAVLLGRMAAAVRALDYQGSFIYEHDGRVDAMRIFHAGGPKERERLVSMSGPRSEVVRDGAVVTCLRSGQPGILFQNARSLRLLPLVPETRNHVLQNYELRSGGEDRVAGYRARVVRIVPRDAYRYGYRLWIEEGTSMLLRSAVLDAGQTTLEQFMFVALDVGAKPKESDLLADSDAGLGPAPVEVALAGPSQWRVTDLPAGFRLLRTQRAAQGADGAEHQMYSDGLASVSVYIEPSKTRGPPEQVLTRGVIAVYTHDSGNWRITALGDVPSITVELMARSVEPVADPR